MIRTHYAVLAAALILLAPVLLAFRFAHAQNYLQQQSEYANQMCADWWKAEQEKKAKDPSYKLKETGPQCSVKVPCQSATAVLAQEGCNIGGHCLRDKCKAEGLPGTPKEAENIEDSGPEGETVKATDVPQNSDRGILSEPPPKSELSSFSKDQVLPSDKFTPPADGRTSDPKSFMGKSFETLKTIGNNLRYNIADSLQELGSVPSFDSSPPFANSNLWNTFSPAPTQYQLSSVSPTPLPSSFQNANSLFSPQTTPWTGGTFQAVNTAPPPSSFSNSPYPWQSAAPSLSGGPLTMGAGIGSNIGESLPAAWESAKATAQAAWDKMASFLSPPESAFNNPDLTFPIAPETTLNPATSDAITGEAFNLPPLARTTDELMRSISEDADSNPFSYLTEATQQARANLLGEVQAVNDRVNQILGQTNPSIDDLRIARDLASVNAEVSKTLLDTRTPLQKMGDWVGLRSPQQIAADTANAQVQTATRAEALAGLSKQSALLMTPEQLLQEDQNTPSAGKYLQDRLFPDGPLEGVGTVKPETPSPTDSQGVRLAEGGSVMNDANKETFGDSNLPKLADTVAELRASLEDPKGTGGRSLDTLLEARQIAREDLRVAQEAAADQSLLKRLGNVVGIESTERANLDAAQKRVDALDKLVATARVDNVISDLQARADTLRRTAQEVGARADAINRDIINSTPFKETPSLAPEKISTLPPSETIRAQNLDLPMTDVVAQEGLEADLDNPMVLTQDGFMPGCDGIVCMAQQTAGDIWGSIKTDAGKLFGADNVVTIDRVGKKGNYALSFSDGRYVSSYDSPDPADFASDPRNFSPVEGIVSHFNDVITASGVPVGSGVSGDSKASSSYAPIGAIMETTLPDGTVHYEGIVDRGPNFRFEEPRIIDLSEYDAGKLGFKEAGLISGVVTKPIAVAEGGSISQRAEYAVAVAREMNNGLSLQEATAAAQGSVSGRVALIGQPQSPSPWNNTVPVLVAGLEDSAVVSTGGSDSFSAGVALANASPSYASPFFVGPSYPAETASGISVASLLDRGDGTKVYGFGPNDMSMGYYGLSSDPPSITGGGGSIPSDVIDAQAAADTSRGSSGGSASGNISPNSPGVTYVPTNSDPDSIPNILRAGTSRQPGISPFDAAPVIPVSSEPLSDITPSSTTGGVWETVQKWASDTWASFTRTPLIDTGPTTELFDIPPRDIGSPAIETIPTGSPFDTVFLSSESPRETLQPVTSIGTIFETRLQEMVAQDVPDSVIPPVPVRKPTSLTTQNVPPPVQKPATSQNVPLPVQKPSVAQPPPQQQASRTPSAPPSGGQSSGNNPTGTSGSDSFGGGSSDGGGSGGSSASGGGSGGGFLQGGLSLLGSLFQSFKDFFSGGSQNGQGQATQQPTQPSQPAPPVQIVGAIVGNPPLVDPGKRSQLSWSSVGTDVSSSTCAVINADFQVIVRGGQDGSAWSPTLTESTRFGLVCNVRQASEKLLNETLVRVRGDDTDPPRIFSDQISAQGTVTGSGSSAPSSGASGSSGGGTSNGGQSGNPTPDDVRTCDPDQSMDSFIICLCEAEPNPAGCTIPPGGL